MTDKQLISKEYLELNRELHNRNQKYGGKGDAWTERVLAYMKAIDAKSYLDYGCGKMNLLNAVKEARPDLAANGYDPVTAPAEPEPADFVTCNDVLEHIEPHLLNHVLWHIKGKMKHSGLLVISQRLANKKLADGRNAHLIVKPTPWWKERLAPYFHVDEVPPIKEKRIGVELAVLVIPKAAPE